MSHRPQIGLALAGLMFLLAGAEAATAEPVARRAGGGSVESFVSPDATGPVEGPSDPTSPESRDAPPTPRAAPSRPAHHRPTGRTPRPVRSGVSPSVGTPAVPPSLPLTYTDWRPLDPASTLVIRTSKGMIIVELHPEFAPQSVARIQHLAREGRRAPERRQCARGDPGRQRPNTLKPRLHVPSVCLAGRVSRN